MAQSGIKAHEGLDTLSPFERLLTEISTSFVGLIADQIDNEIAAAQSRICELLDLDRSTLWITSADDPGTLLLAHTHQPPGLPKPPDRMSARDFFPWTLHKVLSGETFAISKMSELPEEAFRDRESFGSYGTRSCVYVPLSVGKGPVFGLLTFAVTREERDWAKRELKQFQLVAQIFANALARQRSERKLVESEQRLRLITNALPVLIAYVDVELRYRFNNEAYRAWFGVSPDQALGRHIQEVAGEGFFQAARPHLERALSGERVRCALDVATDAGRPLSVEAIYVPDRGGHDGKVRGIYVLAIDVTERNLAQQEYRRLQDELLHAARVSTMGELAGALAHEINQPLSAIMSNAQAAKRYLTAATPDVEELKEILNDIIKEDTRASEVINRIRTLLKKSKMELEPLDLNSIFREILTLLDRDAVRRDIKIDLDPLLPLVRGDRVQLQQVALNLVLNAFGSMNEQPCQKHCVQIRTCLKGTQVLAAVKDNGMGISAGDAEKLFKPFFTTKSEGLGMGLSICRSIILRHHGHIWAENNPDRGATFYFSLPVLSEDQIVSRE
jgi:PAS domain S-box-containing protein